MNPIPVSSLVRSLVSLAKDATLVADKADDFAMDVKPMGTPMRLLASEVRTMSDVGYDFGNIIGDIGESHSKQLLFGRRSEAPAVKNTIQGCENILQQIETAISKATNHISTDPYFIDHVIGLSKREREAFGLTDIDLSILYLKVQRAVAELSLQKELLLSAHSRTKRPKVRNNVGEFRLYEREILDLTDRLEKMTATLRALRERDEREDAEEYHNTNMNQITEQAKNNRPSEAYDAEPHKGIESRPRADTLVDRSHRREWHSAPQLRSAKTPSSNGNNNQPNVTRNGRAPDSTSLQGLGTSAPVDGDTPIEFEAWRFAGPITSASSQAVDGQACLLPFSTEDISTLVRRQRKQKSSSALKRYPLLATEVQDQINSRIAEKEKASELRWSIASIEIQRPNLYQRWRGVRTETAQIIFQGHRRERNRQLREPIAPPAGMSRGRHGSREKLVDTSEPPRMKPEASPDAFGKSTYPARGRERGHVLHGNVQAPGASYEGGIKLPNRSEDLVPESREYPNPRFRRTGHRLAESGGRSDDGPVISDRDWEDNSEDGSEFLLSTASDDSPKDLHKWPRSFRKRPVPHMRSMRRYSFDRQRPGEIRPAEDFRDRGPRSFVATDFGHVDEVDSSNRQSGKRKNARESKPRPFHREHKSIQLQSRNDDTVDEAAIKAEVTAAIASQQAKKKNLRKVEKKERKRKLTKSPIKIPHPKLTLGQDLQLRPPNRPNSPPQAGYVESEQQQPYFPTPPGAPSSPPGANYASGHQGHGTPSSAQIHPDDGYPVQNGFSNLEDD